MSGYLFDKDEFPISIKTAGAPYDQNGLRPAASNTSKVRGPFFIHIHDNEINRMSPGDQAPITV